MSAVKWSYAINQWDVNIDTFVRRRDHERALKTISISGFDAVELTALSFGNWEPLGNPQAMSELYGSVEKFADFVKSCALEGVSSYVYDPFIGFDVEMGRGVDPLDPNGIERIEQTALWFADALVKLGGSVLVVRPSGSAWQTGPLSDSQISQLAKCWNQVGKAISGKGIKLALHMDFLSALRLNHGLQRLLDAADPEFVGCAIDTAEFSIAGIDPTAFYEKNADRVWHIQLKDARVTVDDAEAQTPHAEHFVKTEGGNREIGRWFFEPTDEGGLVDFEKFVSALKRHNYNGWIVVESDLSPHPAESTMVSGWYVQKVLKPLL